MGVDPFTLVPSVVNTGVGLWELISANKAINKLNNTPFPNYSVSPELQNSYNRAEQMATQGYSPAEKGEFRNNVAQDINTGARKALDQSGGNLARVIAKMGTINTLGAEGKFASSNALLKRQNMKYADVLGQAVQRQKNLQTQADIHHRYLLENAYGGAAKMGINNIGSALNFGALMLSGQGGKKANPLGAPPAFSTSSLDGSAGTEVSGLSGGVPGQYDWNMSGQPYQVSPTLNYSMDQ